MLHGGRAADPPQRPGHGAPHARVLPLREIGHFLDDVADDPFADEDPAESGMGLAIIRAVMDDLLVKARPGAPGTLVRMRKSLA